MLDIKNNYLSDVSLLIQNRLFASALWQCRLLIDVVLHLMLKSASRTKKQTRELWEKFNQTERLDKKFARACNLIKKEHDENFSDQLLNRLIESSRKLERGNLNQDLWQKEAKNGFTTIEELIKCCNKLLS